MRRRLLVSTLTIALVAVVTLGVPLLLLARHEVWTSARDTVRQQATSIAAGLEDRLDLQLPVDLARYAQAYPGRHLLVVDPQGRTHSAGPTLTGRLLQSSVRVSGYTITVQARPGPTASRARAVSLLVTGLSLLAVAAAVALSSRQARRLTTPLSELADRADALGRGDFRPAPLDSGIPEIDGVAEVLERSSQQLAVMIEHQRDFASDAAHQLRTPLTGIGLRLEEMSQIGDPSVRQEAEEALIQVDRLDRVVTTLLARARGDSESPARLDLSDLAGQESRSWAVALEQQGRRLVLRRTSRAEVYARREHLAGVLNCLLDNALHHGTGAVVVRTGTAASLVTLEVSDDGPGVPADLAAHIFDRRVTGGHGTGIGLALARSLAQAEGGRLELVSNVGSTFRLTLRPAEME
jgi:signal transduction histidine kinase